MGIAITICGLLIMASGVALSWYKKGAGIWATYGFGFLLVLIGGPLAEKLSEFSLSATGLNANFSVAENVPITQPEDNAEKPTLLNLKIANTDLIDSKEIDEAEASAKISIQGEKQISNLVESLGYYPAPIKGNELFQPGTVVKFIDGRMITWATSNEAFQNLSVESTPTTFPAQQLTGIIDSLNGSKSETKVNFECSKGARVSQVSLSSLNTSVRKNIFSNLRDADSYVVQSALLCDGFELSSRVSASVAVELSPALKKLIGVGMSGESTIRYEYETEEPVALGYRLVSISE